MIEIQNTICENIKLNIVLKFILGNIDAESESDIVSTPGVISSRVLGSGSCIPPNFTASDNTIRKRKEAEDQEFSFDH